jgi:hypothetical protein
VTAHSIIAELRSRGVEVALDGERLVLRAARPLPAGEIDVLRQLKSDIIECLRRESAISVQIEAMRSIPCPNNEPPERFERYRAGAIGFAREWGAKALAAGWTEEELFSFAVPFANVERRGAAWFVANNEVIEVAASAITIRTASGAMQRIYRKSLQ